MSERSSIRIVVFDLGGVVVRICRTWDGACHAAGVPVREGWSAPDARERRRALNLLYQSGKIGCDEFFSGISASARSGGTATNGIDPGAPLYTPEEIRRVHHAWTREEYPGVSKLVDDLHAAQVITGVLSNTNYAHWSRLAPPSHEPAIEYPTPRRMRHVHASHLLGMLKPNREIYDEFARRTGFRAGAAGTGERSEIIFFDDLIENVEAARNAGWLAVHIDHTGDTAKQIRVVLREHGVL